MQILVSGEESVVLSVHYDKGKVPKVVETSDMTDHVCQKEIKIGQLVIQVFERDKCQT